MFTTPPSCKLDITRVKRSLSQRSFAITAGPVLAELRKHCHVPLNVKIATFVAYLASRIDHAIEFLLLFLHTAIWIV